MKSKRSPFAITMIMPNLFGKGQKTTMSRKTTKPSYRLAFRESRSTSWILDADLGETSSISKHWDIVLSAWMAVRSFAGSPVVTRSVRSFNKAFLTWNCRKPDSMASLPTPRSSMSPVRHCPEFSMNYTTPCDPAASCFLRILAVTMKGGKDNGTVITWNWRPASPI